MLPQWCLLIPHLTTLVFGRQQQRMVAGYQLDRIHTDFRLLVAQTRQFNMTSIEMVCRFSMEMVKDLTADSTRPAWMDLADPTFQPSGFEGLSSESDATPLLIFAHLRRMETAFHLKNYVVADMMRKNFDMYKRKMNMFVVESTGCFFSCLTSMAMTQQQTTSSKKKPFKSIAQAELAKMKQWLTKRGAINIIHRFNIMQAQFAVCFRQQELRKEKIKTLFENAIVSATRAGFLNDAALVNDLAGEYMLSAAEKDADDAFWANHYFTASYELYKSWGAKAKTKLLLELQGPYINLEELSKRRMTTTQRSKELVTKTCADRISSIHME